ncbi:YmiA family putative membrane protein [Escherichia coli]|nr:YmiA family putative membrane protein [Escherichia coli]OMG95972.1 hypothetical protein A8M31_16120 [Escherichia coli]
MSKLAASPLFWVVVALLIWKVWG